MSDPLREDWQSDARPGWYLRYLDARVRAALSAVEALPEPGDPGLPVAAAPVVARVAEHLEWCARQLAAAVDGVGPVEVERRGGQPWG